MAIGTPINANLPTVPRALMMVALSGRMLAALPSVLVHRELELSFVGRYTNDQAGKFQFHQRQDSLHEPFSSRRGDQFWLPFLLPSLFPCQNRLEEAIAIQVVAQISKSYFCLGPSHVDRAYHKIACQLKLAAKNMLDPDSDFRSLMIGRLLGFRERRVSVRPLVNMTGITGCRQIVLRLLASDKHC